MLPILWIGAAALAGLWAANAQTPSPTPTPTPTPEPTPEPEPIVPPPDNARTAQYDAFLHAYAQTSYHALIAQQEQKCSLPENLLARLLWEESRYDPKAVSPAGAQGIAQFEPATAAEYGIDPFDPDQAIPAAARYLRSLWKSLGSWREAVAAYNWGIGHIQRQGYDNAPPETVAYVDDILRDSESGETA